MKIEDQVCSFEQAKRLKEVGVIIVTYWSYVGFEGEYDLKDLAYKIEGSQESYSAPTVAELIVMLEKLCGEYYIFYNLHDKRLNIQEWADVERTCPRHLKGFYGEKTASIIAEAVIWMIEERILKAEDLKL